MIDGRSVLGVILARGGSKGLPRKNIRDLAGKPLIAWTIEAGHESEYLDRLILSSDDKEIIAVAEEYDCEVPFQRPAELAQDDTPSMEALLHALDQVSSYEYVVLLQPTSPFRNSSDIDSTIERCHRSKAPACVTVTEVDKPPHWMYILDKEGRLEPVLGSDRVVNRRQDTPPTFMLNGAVYVARTEWIKKTRDFVTKWTTAYVMPEERSMDVDTQMDLKWCNFLVSSV